MEETKLTVRVPRDLLENAKRYVARNNTTLAGLIRTYQRHIPDQSGLENELIVNGLRGSLSPDLSPQDYKKHLEEKYS